MCLSQCTAAVARRALAQHAVISEDGVADDAKEDMADDMIESRYDHETSRGTWAACDSLSALCAK